MTKNHFLLMGGLAAVVLATATEARPVGQTATDGTELAQAMVRYGDLDLASPDGRTVLKHRVEVAARSVCTIGGFDSAGTEISDPACIRSALANADHDMTTAIAARQGAPILVVSSPIVGSADARGR